MKKDATAGNKGKSSSLGRNIILMGIIAVAVFLVVSGLWLKSLWNEVYEIAQPEGGGFKLSFPDKEQEPLPDIMNVLILGLDSRDPVARADTVMLLTLNRRTGEINIISVPRDMRINIPGYGLDKINHAHAYGGVPLTRQALEDFLDIKIDHYMTTDFDGFTNIVDILGGIELDVEKRMRYYGIDVTIELDPGLQHLDGEKALEYVRWRGDGEGDFGRVRRQQNFLKALLQEIITFKNVLKFPRLLPEMAQNMKTDLELSQALVLANKLKNIEIEEINTLTLPGNAGYVDGISYVLPQEDKIREMVERYIKGKEMKKS
ncbi:MAG: LCP family protein [Bacillota bacterium]|nr:LCP family protein [Bacillota bacterium]